VLNVRYGEGEVVDWTALAAEAIEVVVDGEASAEAPLFLDVSFGSPSPSGATIYSGHGVRIEAAGTYQLLLASFAPWPVGSPGADLHEVRYLNVLLGDCREENCVNTGYPARTYSLGPIRMITSGATSSRRATWSRLKQFYR
jgi:hypothetical protein